MSSGEYHDRLRKMNELRDMGINPYPARFDSTHTISEAIELGEKNEFRDLEEMTSDVKSQVTIRGRMMTIRAHGKLTFANIKDITGMIQVCFMQDVLGKETYKLLRKFDMADFVGVTGELFVTKHGQLTILVKEFTFLGKALRPLPEKWHGLQDKETIYRQRYLDTLMSEESMKRFLLRSQFTQGLRTYLNSHAFLEVETPILGVKASGATARPFATHHNALDLPVFLRIAPELGLKKYVAAGFERVYEIAKCFRNEGMDPSHLQEFTMLEFYGAYWNYEDNMSFTESMLKHVIQDVFGTLKIEIKDREGNMVEVDFGEEWPRLDFGKLIEDDCGLNIYDYTDDANGLRSAIKKAGIKFDDMDKMGYGNLCDYLYKKVSRPKLVQPCFVINHPASMKPLARRSDENPHYCETFQLLVNTWEVINAYSEIVDPIDQKDRFINQAVAQAGGDDDAMEMDVDFLTAMEHGMPPISGNGIGIDRLMTLLTGQDNLRDLVFFPLMRPTEENLKAEKKMREKAKKIYKKQQKAAKED